MSDYQKSYATEEEFNVRLGIFRENAVSLAPKPGKLEELHASLVEMRGRKPHKVTLGEIMVVAGKLIILLMSCLNKMDRGGTATFLPMVGRPLRLHWCNHQ